MPLITLTIDWPDETDPVTVVSTSFDVCLVWNPPAPATGSSTVSAPPVIFCQIDYGGGNLVDNGYQSAPSSPATYSFTDLTETSGDATALLSAQMFNADHSIALSDVVGPVTIQIQADGETGEPGGCS
jgi:hypothetical protein